MQKLASTGLAILIGSFVAGCGSNSSGTGGIALNGDCSMSFERREIIGGEDTLRFCDLVSAPASECQSMKAHVQMISTQQREFSFKEVTTCPSYRRLASCVWLPIDRKNDTTYFYLNDDTNASDKANCINEGGQWTEF